MGEYFAHKELIVFLTAFGVILIVSRLMAEVMRRIKMPSVLGEIFTGIILGPTVLGTLAPGVFEGLFPFIADPQAHHDVAVAMDALISVSVILLLFVAGMEVQLPLVIEQGKTALLVTFFGMIFPIAAGFVASYMFPSYFGIGPDDDMNLFGFFIGVVMSITALPVIARIMMDMNIFKTRIGMTIIASAMLIDMLGWLIFSVILTLMDSGTESKSFGFTVVSILLFGGFMLTFGTKIIDKALPWIQAKFAWPGGVLSLSLGLCLLGAAFTESLGIHAILGAFIVGIALGDSPHLREGTAEIIHQFVTNVFAPLFFVSIGLYTNFISNFNLWLVLILLAFAYISKIAGAKIGAAMGGLTGKDSWAVGMAMSTHGALEIILGSLAVKADLINEEVFVAIVLLVIISIITAAPLLKPFLSTKTKRVKKNTS